jgi:transposase
MQAKAITPTSCHGFHARTQPQSRGSSFCGRQRVTAWEYNRAMYKRRNEIERLFRRLKGFRRIFSRFEKLDVMFVAFINFALIVDGLR